MPIHQIDCVVEISCGTLIINEKRQVLLGHVSDRDYWDIPKGRQEFEETPLEAAKRELKEETGLEFNEAFYEEIGCFDYREDKKLHLYKIHVSDTLQDLACLKCTSYFPRSDKQELVLAMDGYRWATKDELSSLCLPRLANRLLALDW